MSFIILSSVLTGIIGLLSYFLYHWSYWIRHGISGPRGYPVVGVCNITYNGDYPPYLRIKEWGKVSYLSFEFFFKHYEFQIYGPIFGFTEGIKKTLVISDPEIVNEVFVKQFDNFYGRKLNALHGDPEKDKKASMFMAQGFRWKRLRTISSPTFSNNSLRKVTGTIEECSLELLRHIENQTSDGQQIDMLHFYQEFTLDVIGRIAMGQIGSQMFQNPLFPHVRSIFGESRQKIMMIGAVSPAMVDLLKWAIQKFGRFIPTKTDPSLIWKTVEKAVQKRIEERSKDENYPKEPQDFNDLFLDAKSDEVENDISSKDYSLKYSHAKISKRLTKDEIISQCTLFIIAGFDTTALSLSFTTYLLTNHPEVQRKLQAELDRECKDSEVTFDNLSKLKYLECVMKETLRLYPLASPANSRTCMNDTVIGDGIRVEKGVHVVANTWAIHTDPKIWGDNANEFKPERWESPPNSHQTFLSFGLGPRQCIGMRLAYMEEKMLLAHILRKYSFETGSKTELPMKLVGRATTQPTSVWMHLVARE
ncbi:hypothetical protein CRE_07685 [Caenorhabditis remanei]|uniref:Uncharacterized protein n=1 Tax=Caenorhabditis remanei TaxID=31234 RepID=E3MZW3_CAERE|nr:hypothetical protein CRE_07685 [Caenorhabditis remanei]